MINDALAIDSNTKHTFQDFTISTKYFRGSKKIHDLYLNGKVEYLDDNVFLVVKGEILFPDINYHDIIKRIKNDGFKHLSHVKGEYAVAYYDKQDQVLYVVNDMLGIEPVYYTHENLSTGFVVSTDFWKLVDVIKPEVRDFNTQAIKELVFFYKPLFNETIIKCIRSLRETAVLTYEVGEHSMRFDEYWDFSFDEACEFSLETVFRRLDDSIDRTVRRVVERNGASKTYGVGISGGLDTRIIPYYLKKNGVKNIESFIIGRRNPKNFLLSRDHKNARKIARYYNIPHAECEYDSEKFEDKIYYDIRAQPLRSSNILKVLTKNLPDFDILITGGYGTIVGGHLINEKLESLSEKELAETITSTFSRINPPQRKRNFIQKMLRFLKMLFNIGVAKGDNRRLRRKSLQGVISEDEFISAMNKIYEYVVDEKRKGKTNYDIFMKYHLFISNKYGAFESLSGTMKSYSIYYPLTLEEVQQWSPDYVIGRKVLEYLVFNNVPELTKVPGQNWRIPSYYNFKDTNNFTIRIQKAISLFMFYLRGSGLRYDDWVKEEGFSNFSKKILERENEYFHSIFNTETIMANIDDMEELVFENVVKMKYVLDCIINKEYEEWYESEE